MGKEPELQSSSALVRRRWNGNADGPDVVCPCRRVAQTTGEGEGRTSRRLAGKGWARWLGASLLQERSGRQGSAVPGVRNNAMKTGPAETAKVGLSKEQVIEN